VKRHLELKSTIIYRDKNSVEVVKSVIYRDKTNVEVVKVGTNFGYGYPIKAFTEKKLCKSSKTSMD
jgi:hypothetical protein